jgi:hypothetical protein
MDAQEMNHRVHRTIVVIVPKSVDPLRKNRGIPIAG